MEASLQGFREVRNGEFMDGGSPSSDGFTEAVTQVDRTTVYSSGAGDGLQDKEDR